MTDYHHLHLFHTLIHCLNRPHFAKSSYSTVKEVNEGSFPQRAREKKWALISLSNKGEEWKRLSPLSLRQRNKLENRLIPHGECATDEVKKVNERL